MLQLRLNIIFFKFTSELSSVNIVYNVDIVRHEKFILMRTEKGPYTTHPYIGDNYMVVWWPPLSRIVCGLVAVRGGL